VKSSGISRKYLWMRRKDQLDLYPARKYQGPNYLFVKIVQ